MYDVTLDAECGQLAEFGADALGLGGGETGDEVGHRYGGQFQAQ
jgi:hypothetical protein